jgi:DNA-binding MarR family transcriptional regulator
MDAPRWLDETEQSAWRAWVAVMRLLPDRLAVRLQQRHKLTLTDYQILVALSESAGRRMRMTELAEHTLLSKSRLSHQINRMEQSGLVERQGCPTDRRGSFAVLTEHGFAVLREAAVTHVEDVRAHFVDLVTPEQLAALGASLWTIADHLQEARTLPQPRAHSDPCDEAPDLTDRPEAAAS